MLGWLNTFLTLFLMTRWLGTFSMTMTQLFDSVFSILNKSKTKIVRSTNFLMLVWPPGHSGMKSSSTRNLTGVWFTRYGFYKIRLFSDNLFTFSRLFAQKIFLNRALTLLFCSAGWIVQGGWWVHCTRQRERESANTIALAAWGRDISAPIR